MQHVPKQWEENGNMKAIGMAAVELAGVTAMQVSDNCVMIITHVGCL